MPNVDPLGAIGDRLRVLGGLLLAAFIVLVITGLIPELQWLLSPSPADRNKWVEDILPVHAYWVAMLCMAVAAIAMLRLKAMGHALAIICSIFWLGMQVFHWIFFSIRYPSQLARMFISTLGLSIPPTATTLGTLFCNVVFLSILVVLYAPTTATAFSQKQRSQAILLGFGLLIYGIACFIIKEALAPPPDFGDLQF